MADRSPRRIPAARRRWSVGLVVVAVVALVTVALSNGSGQRPTRITLTGGAAWLASPDRGFVTLIDGASEQVVTTVRVAASTGLTVVQNGPSALVTDNVAGTVAVIDGTDYSVASVVAFAGTTPSSLNVLATPTASFVVDGIAGTARVIDPVTLAVRSEVALGGRPGPGQLLADDTGRLWSVDSEGSGLAWLDSDATVGRVDAAPTDLLSMVDGRPALIRAGEPQPEVGWLGEDGSWTAWPCRLAVADGDSFSLLGSRHSHRIYAAVSDTGTLVTADPDGSRCRESVTIGTAQSRFGPLVESGPFVFVPDASTGVTTVIDTDQGDVVATLELSVPGNDLELLVKDGLVFYNDLDSERAGVVKQGANGRWIRGTSLAKYDVATGEPIAPVLPTSSSAVTSIPVSSDEVPIEPGDLAVTSSVVSTSSLPSSTSAAVTSSSTSRPPTSTSTSSPPSSSSTSTSSTSSTSEPPPVPVVGAITSTGVLEVGSPASFAAQVSAPSGAWNWSARSDAGATLGTGTSEQSFSIGAIPEGVTTVTVTLSVGNSAPGNMTFDVGTPVKVAAVLDIVSLTPEEMGNYPTDVYTLSVRVSSSTPGLVPTGEVVLDLQNLSGGSVVGDGMRVTLVDGEARFENLSTAGEGELQFGLEYLGDLRHLTDTNGTFVAVYPLPEVVFQSTCSPKGPGQNFYMELTPDTNGEAMTVDLATASGGSGRLDYDGAGVMVANSSAYVSPPSFEPGEAYVATVFDPSTGRSTELTGSMPSGCIG